MKASETPIEAYDPADVIEEVNKLQPLGKDGALTAIETYLKARESRQYPYGLLWILRVLFDVPAGMAFPPVALGTPAVPAPVKSDLIPRYPILILRDIPLLVSGGYFLRGLPEPVEVHVEFFRKNGIMRSQLLKPQPGSDIESEFRAIWQQAYPGADPSAPLGVIQAQIARMSGAE